MASEAVFTEIFEKHLWGPIASGPGSSLAHTARYREFLIMFIQEKKITSVLDIGCGDWEFSKMIPWAGIGVTYTGIDVVPHIVNLNIAKYGGAKVKFICQDVSDLTKPLPAADLVLVKDILAHWPIAMISAFLPRLKPYKRVLFTHAVAKGPNTDIKLGDWRPIDLAGAPFNLKVQPVFTLDAGTNRQTFLWQSGTGSADQALKVALLKRAQQLKGEPAPCVSCSEKAKAAATNTISVCIPGCNEKDIWETAKSALTNKNVAEVILLDDASDEPVVGVTADIEPAVTVVRSNKQLGTGRARNMAAAFARGQIIVHVDAHMRFPDNVLYDIGTIALQTGAIVCPLCQDMKHGSKYWGATIFWYPKAEFGLDIKWLEVHPKTPTAPVPSVLGACYAIRKDVWEALGGFSDTNGIWGYDEQSLSLKAQFLNIPRLLYTRKAAIHQFRDSQEQPYKPQGRIFCQGARACFVAFGDEIWKKHMRPWFAPKVGEDNMLLMENDPGTRIERAMFAAKKKVKDDEVFAWLVKNAEEYYATHPKP